MSIYYKFKNTINYDAVKFDGVYISASDLKQIIIQEKKLGQSDLQVKNEETGQLYTDDQLIPKNTNIIVSRLPFANANKKSRLMANQPYPTGGRFSASSNSSGSTATHLSNSHQQTSGTSSSSSSISVLTGSSSSSSASTMLGGSNSTLLGGNNSALELVTTKDMSEEEKIKYIQSQSTKDFDPTRYARGRGGGPNRAGRNFVPGPGYTCRKCGIQGHLIYDCKSSNVHKVKRSSGIPRDFLMKVDSKEKGALMTPSGEYAVPYIDREAYNNPKIEKAPFFEDGTPSDSTN